MNFKKCIQSDKNTGFQDFTNIKYNLQKFWKEAENISNYNEIILRTEEKYKTEVNKQSKKNSPWVFILYYNLRNHLAY